ncbi:DUF975 family protein [Phytopseudomonas dryadis]|uniref:Glycerophosphoryl diester phosphodiesterase membrane domain-containing protein n=1 Tax=Phytopseudomonas dryadis TaxID=2487520 RepID=A0A4Q9R723_9GAMM|nr:MULTISPECIES: hypothetical protein [Pseudomonas]TBU96342.1 hypothetical protein DNK44_04085 [Pseudomonas dryadis]TBV00871.1 hypothetical protein DNK34_22370 [Pseudomonas dryadis]TBV13584.1 hypothetical protein DNK41_22220 [Pseudomonas sp. FRB 230]
MGDASSTNPYAVPGSELQEAPNNDQAPSIEQALSRGYDFSIGALISEAWQLTKGTKGVIFAGLLVFNLAFVLASFPINVIFDIFDGLGEGLILILLSLVVTIALTLAVCYPILTGLGMIGIRRAAGQPVSVNDIFSCFSRTVPLLITGVLMVVLIYVGFLLFILPGIYFSVAYMLAAPLVVERGLSPWQAMEASRKAITQHWFKVFGLLLLLGLILAISAIPLGIGLIWTVPLFVVAMGVLYRTLFGVLPVAR